MYTWLKVVVAQLLLPLGNGTAVEKTSGNSNTMAVRAHKALP